MNVYPRWLIHLYFGNFKQTEPVSVRSSRSMSQPRVTDYFTRRKKGITAEVKPSARYGRLENSSSAISAPPAASENKDLQLSPVRQEFVRVIDDAVGLNDGCKNSPRTPKRISDVSPATTDASPAKKRQTGATGGFKDDVCEKGTKRKPRKRLVLPDSPPVSGDATPAPAAPAPRRADVEPGGLCLGEETARWRTGAASKALSKEDMASLRTRLRMVKTLREETAGVTSPTAPSTSADPSRLKVKLAQARELAAQVQRHKEREEGQSQQPDAETQDSETPAYQRYHSLAQAAASPGLSLPYHYKVLAEMFRSMETVVAMLYNRCETATFAKIKQGVQDMMHKRFEESHVAQIKTVFPGAYTFRQEKNVPPFSSSLRRGSFQLTVEPSFTSGRQESRPLLSASRLLERRRTFHVNLVSIVKQHHTAFLSSLVPPMRVPADRLTRWHPRFNVDTVPAVELSLLPQPPQTEKLATAQEVLEKARSLITPKMEKALVSLLPPADGATELEEAAASQASADPVPNGLRGLSKSLVDRIRAKEAQKMKAAMTRKPGQAERLLMMSRLPELARILRNVFVEEKKPALIMEVACNRMATSYRSALSPGDMEKHVRLLAEVAADWLAIHPIRKDFYLKLNKEAELSSVVARLGRRLEEEEQHG